MNKGLMASAACGLMLLWLAVPAEAQIYKVVDENGNVTYTDQPPNDGSDPMDLPDLSVVDTDYPPPAVEDTEDEAAEAAPAEPTPRELRRMYRDFAITRPQPEETFWGTNNMVVVSWSSPAPLRQGMSVRLFVDGALHSNSTQPVTAITLERGEHTVRAELLDDRGRRIAGTETVTFFVHQYSANFNRPQPTPRNN